MIQNLLNLHSQEVLCSWLSAPNGVAGQQFLFARTYAGTLHAGNARLAIAAKGPFRLYVNGRAVYTSYVFGDALAESEGCESYVMDVTPYMRNDSNSVAVWYAPDAMNAGSGNGNGAEMIAVSLYGSDSAGRCFAFASDSTWLCSPAPAVSEIMAEHEDARLFDGRWHAPVPSVQMKWSGAVQLSPVWIAADANYFPGSFADSRVQVVAPRYFDASDDGRSVSYDFGNGFWGTVRVTVRGAKVGERIYVNGAEYICKGTLDEQYVGRFVHYGLRRVTISGDASFRRSHITKVEGLALDGGSW